MKKFLLLIILMSAYPIIAMEPEEPIMSSEEIEQLWREQEEAEETEWKAHLKRPWVEETAQEKQANLAQQLAFLKASANYEQLPDELKLHALSFLVTAPGADNAEQLRNAANNIRTVMRVNKDSYRLLDDQVTIGYLIRELAQRYTKKDIVAAALALRTKAAAKWLKNNIINENDTLLANYHLMFAIDNENMSTINFLLQALPESILFEEQLPIPLESQNRYGKEYLPGTWLIYAVIKGNVEIVKKLIKAKIPLEARDDEGLTALMEAARYRVQNLEMVKALLDAGAQVNAYSIFGNALYFAIEAGNFPIIRELLARGALRYDTLGQNPIHIAATIDQANLIRPLLELGFDINEVTRYSHETALMLAITNDSCDFFDKLMAIPGIQLDLQDADERTALHRVVVDYQNMKNMDAVLEYARDLLQAGANPNIADEDDKTALDYVQEFPEDTEPGRTELIDLLKSYGAKRGSEL